VTELVQFIAQTGTNVIAVLNDENSALAWIAHGHLVEIFGSGEISRRPFLIMDYETAANRVAEYIKGSDKDE
jgi:hypothetical protein